MENMQQNLHSRFTGDVEKLTKKLDNAGILGKQVNVDQRGQHKVLHVDEIIPFDEQRDTADSWIYKTLKKREGFDWMAAGTLNVMHIPEGIMHKGRKYYYVCWNGIGRLAQAQIQGIEYVDCWVTTGSTEDSAYYFVYNQDEGMRTLAPQIKFANKVAYADPEATNIAKILSKVNLCIKTNADRFVPAKKDGTKEIKINAFTKALKSAQQGTNLKLAIELCLMSRNWITTGYQDAIELRGDLFHGGVLVFKTYPKLRQPGKTFDAFQKFLCANAKLRSMRQLTFKQTGGNLHNNEVGSVALGIIKEFTNSTFCTSHMAQFLRHERIKTVVGIGDDE